MDHGKIIKVRKFKGEEYFFKYNEGINRNNFEDSYITCQTPENCFGYPDTVLLSSTGQAYTLWRHLPQWILKQIEKVMHDLTMEYCT